MASLPAILKEAGCKNLFLVVDSSYRFLCIRETIESLKTERKVLFSDFTPNPLFEQVCKGVELLRESGCDTILAVGGGSAIDVAKCIKLAAMAEEGCFALIPPLVSERISVRSGLPFIAIPTTAGTGSESTHNAVMYYEGSKQTVTNDGILPDYALLEPSVLATLPLYQKKCTMMDALCQGIESWWSVNSTAESMEYSRKTIELIIANWRKYIFGNDNDAAGMVMLAANYSGRAINIAQTTAAHAMSYKLTSMYGLPHGLAAALCLPEIWEFMTNHPQGCADARGIDHMMRVFDAIAHTMGARYPEEAVSIFRNMLDEMNLELAVSVNRETDIPILCSSVNPVRLKNNPVQLNTQDIEYLYRVILRP